MATYKVFIEIPQDSANKYEYDEKTGEFILDFIFRDGVKFPSNYGYLPKTLTEDGDAIDFMVYSTEPILPGMFVEVKPVAIARMKDRGKQDNKIISVPVRDPLANLWDSLQDFSADKQNELIDFYRNVAIQKQKEIIMEGFYDKDTAVEEIEKSKI